MNNKLQNRRLFRMVLTKTKLQYPHNLLSLLNTLQKHTNHDKLLFDNWLPQYYSKLHPNHRPLLCFAYGEVQLEPTQRDRRLMRSRGGKNDNNQILRLMHTAHCNKTAYESSFDGQGSLIAEFRNV